MFRFLIEQNIRLKHVEILIILISIWHDIQSSRRRLEFRLANRFLPFFVWRAVYTSPFDPLSILKVFDVHYSRDCLHFGTARV